MIVSIVRYPVHEEKDRNRKAADDAFRRAEQDHADLLVFPETFMASVVNQSNRDLTRAAESLDGPFVAAMQNLACTFGIWTVFGMLERPSRPDSLDRVYNTVVTLNHHGAVVNVYRKTHLYDAFGTKESDVYLKGDALPTVIEAPFGRFAVEVCYELRFPEISRYLALQDIHLLVVPAAWYQGPNKASHWELLLRARALENTIFVVGTNQGGPVFAGQSMVVDPLGVPVATRSDEENFLSCSMDINLIAEVRKRLPCIQQTRPELFHNP